MESREICITRRSKAFQGTDRQPHMPSPPENLDSSLQNIVLRPAIHQFIAVLLRLPSTVSPSTPRFHGPPYINAALFEPSTSASSNVIKRSSHKYHKGKEEYIKSDIDRDGPKFLSLSNLPRGDIPHPMAASGSHNVFSPMMAQMLRDSTFSRSTWSGSAASRK